MQLNHKKNDVDVCSERTELHHFLTLFSILCSNSNNIWRFQDTSTIPLEKKRIYIINKITNSICLI